MSMYYKPPAVGTQREDLLEALWAYWWGDLPYAIELMTRIVILEVTDDYVEKKQSSQTQRKAEKIG